jgi:hypothetical protein
VDGRGDRDGESPWSSLDRPLPEAARAKNLRDTGLATPELFELDPEKDAEAFRNAIQKLKENNKYSASVYVYDTEEYKNMRLFSTEDGTAGIALKPDGDIVSGFVYADSPHKGAVLSMLSQMVELGGDRLDAFDTVLPGIYAKAGFKPVARVAWDDDYAPPGWDKDTYSKFNNGEPDVVIMAYDPERVGADYNPEEGEVYADYDEAIAARNAGLDAPENSVSSDKLANVDIGLSDFEPEDLDESEAESPEDNEVAAAAKLRLLMSKYPALDGLSRGLDGSKMSSPIKALKELDKVLEELGNFDLTALNRTGYEVRPAFLDTMDSSVKKIKEILRNNFSDSEMSDFELDVFAKLISYNSLTGTFNSTASTDPKGAAAALLKKQGVSIKNPDAAAVRAVTFPVKSRGESYAPDPGAQEYSNAMDAIDALNKAVSEGSIKLPESLDLNSIPMDFILDLDAFADVYKANGGSGSSSYAKKRVLGSNSGQAKLDKKMSAQTEMRDIDSRIIFNLSLMSIGNADFGTNLIAETIFHEFGHSIHRGLGLGFGASSKSVFDKGRSLNARYRAAKAEFVSPYGEDSVQEHFSESFSKYMSTGMAGFGWMNFMEEVGILKD